jgi:hypothetical protein
MDAQVGEVREEGGVRALHFYAPPCPTMPMPTVCTHAHAHDREVSVGVNVHGVVGITRRDASRRRTGLVRRTTRTGAPYVRENEERNEHTLAPVKTIFPETKMRRTTVGHAVDRTREELRVAR